MIKNHKDLLIWQKSMLLTKQVYSLTKSLPATEAYTLSSQILRASISIPSNIAEGFGRNSKLEFVRFLNIAHGSACEVETQLEIIAMIYSELQTIELKKKVIEIQKMIKGLTTKIKPPAKN
jgi:four helix bundle protein